MLTRQGQPEPLLEFPCNYEFKVFGLADAQGRFQADVRSAVSGVIPISHDAMRSRLSSAGRYQCVTVLVRLHDSDQLKAIYSALRGVDGLKYLL